MYLDINECEDDPEFCGMNANCTNTVGSYMCSCSSGYTEDGTMCTGERKHCFLKLFFTQTHENGLAGKWTATLVIHTCIYTPQSIGPLWYNMSFGLLKQ